MNFLDYIDKKFQPLQKGEVQIWSMKAIEDNKLLDGFTKLLSEDEILRADKYRFEKDRSVYITAKFLLRSMLGKYVGKNPKEITFEYSKFAKPFYLQNAEVDFNVSHSGNQIIIGFSMEAAIGVDIEKIKKDFDPLGLAKSFFSKQEIKALSKTDESDIFQAFYRCWTRKESFIKAVGEGLSYPLDSFAVSLDDDENAEFLKIENPKDSKEDWQLHSFVPAEGYIAAITTNRKPNKIEFFDANDFLR